MIYEDKQVFLNFTGKLEEDGVTMFFYCWKAAKNYSKTSKNIKFIEWSKWFKFLTRKWNIVSDHLNANYDVGNEVNYNAEVLKSNLFYYNDAEILVRGDIVTAAHNIPTQVAFKICALFNTCITKIYGTSIDDAEDLDLVMPMYNLI